VATSGWIEDRWLKKRPNPKTGKRERTELYGKCLRYRVAGIPGVRKRSFETLNEAKEWKAQTIAAMRKHEFVDERDGEILLGDYIRDEWWPKRTDAVNTAIPMKSKIFNHIVDTSLGRTPMYVIEDKHLVEWKREVKGRGIADSTLEVIWNHLSSIFKSAVGKRIARNPCTSAETGVRPAGPGGTKARAWTKEEARAIRTAMPRRYQMIPSLGVRAGQRQAETFGFSPDDVDRERMLVHVRRQLLWENSTRPYFKLPKGDKERDVPLSPGLLKEIDEYVEEFPPVAVTLPWRGPGNDNKPAATVRLLVTTAHGNRLHPSTFSNRTMKPALAAAGLIAPRKEGTGWGWEASREMMHHRWRHTYASVQLAAGEDIISVSHWLGHASPDITFKIYAHFMPDHGMRGRTAMDNWLTADAPTTTDLRAVEPVAFTEADALALTGDLVQGPTELMVSGARFGGAWVVGVQLAGAGARSALLGEIRTEATSDPDRALAAALLWVSRYCEGRELAVVQAENLNGQFPQEVRPYQALARFVVVPAEAVS
jgi:integrase